MVVSTVTVRMAISDTLTLARVSELVVDAPFLVIMFAPVFGPVEDELFDALFGMALGPPRLPLFGVASPGSGRAMTVSWVAY